MLDKMHFSCRRLCCEVTKWDQNIFCPTMSVYELFEWLVLCYVVSGIARWRNPCYACIPGGLCLSSASGAAGWCPVAAASGRGWSGQYCADDAAKLHWGKLIVELQPFLQPNHVDSDNVNRVLAATSCCWNGLPVNKQHCEKAYVIICSF